MIEYRFWGVGCRVIVGMIVIVVMIAVVDMIYRERGRETEERV